VRYVDDDALPGGDGLSWATAYRYLQDAMFDAASDPGIDEVRIAGGLHRADRDEAGNVTPGDRLATLTVRNGLHVLGGYRGLAGGGDPNDRDIGAFETIVSGDLQGNDGPAFSNNGENSYHVFTVTGVGPGTLLDGITVEGGNANGPEPHALASAVNGRTSSPTLRDCTFRSNAGGPVLLTLGAARIESCGFTGNAGGALRNSSAANVIVDSTFADNSGGALLNGDAPTVVVRCSFDGNTGSFGGAVNNYRSDGVFLNCTFHGNVADEGGAIYNNGSDPQVVNCIFVGNRANYDGGAFNNVVQSFPTLINCTVVGNYARQSGAGAGGGGLNSQHSSNPTLINCVIWGNKVRECLSPGQVCAYVSSSETQLKQTGGSYTVRYSCIQGGAAGVGNISLDPLFTRPSSIGADDVPGTGDDDYGDLRLQAGSPAADSGDNDALPADDHDLDADLVLAEPLPLDLTDAPRVGDDPVAADGGNPPMAAPYVNMGAFEAPVQRILVSAPSVSVPEGGTNDVLVSLALNPGGPVDVTTTVADGDPDITVQSGGVLSFDATNYAVDQVVTLAAAADADFISETATIRLSGAAAPDTFVVAREIDDEPVPPVLHVDIDTAPGGNGATWATAIDQVQSALYAAGHTNGGVERIWVAEGVYRPDQGVGAMQGSRLATFALADGLAVLGGFAGGEMSEAERDPDAHPTVLSGDLNGDDVPGFVNYTDNAYHVVSGVQVGASALLDGFTVRGGNADGPPGDLNVGGGVTLRQSGALIRRCVIEDNRAWTLGGGLFIGNGSPRIEACRLHGNAVVGTGKGGGAAVSDGGPIIAGCTLEDNTAYFGAGVSNEVDSTPLFVNCTIRSNKAVQEGGGVYTNASDPTFVNCVLTNNASGYEGGAMNNVVQSNPVLVNCTVTGNETGTSGAGLGGGGLNVQHSSHAQLHNCTLWKNVDLTGEDTMSAQVNFVSGGSATIRYSDVSGLGSPIDGNISSDPLFAAAPTPGLDGIRGTDDDDDGDLRLTTGSPCIDAADNDLVPTDGADLDGDLNVGEPLPFDIAREPRFRDDPATPDTGNGAAPIVDMGAYEFPGMDTDCNENQVPDSVDIQNGTSPDVNENGVPDECEYVVFTAVADAFLASGHPNRNEGANPRLWVRSTGHNRALMAFDLSSIQPSDVAQATLALTIAENHDNWGANNDRTVDAHPLLVPFIEGNGQNLGVPNPESTRGEGAGVTWNCAEDADVSNQAPDCQSQWDGGIYGPPTAPPVVHVNGLTGDVSWDVTIDVQAGATNSWIVRKTNEGQPGFVEYYSREGSMAAFGNLSAAPRLVILTGK